MAGCEVREIRAHLHGSCSIGLLSSSSLSFHLLCIYILCHCQSILPWTCLGFLPLTAFFPCRFYLVTEFHLVSFLTSWICFAEMPSPSSSSFSSAPPSSLLLHYLRFQDWPPFPIVPQPSPWQSSCNGNMQSHHGNTFPCEPCWRVSDKVLKGVDFLS